MKLVFGNWHLNLTPGQNTQIHSYESQKGEEGIGFG